MFQSLPQVKRAWSRQMHDAEAVAKQHRERLSIDTSVRLKSLVAAEFRDGCLLSVVAGRDRDVRQRPRRCAEGPGLRKRPRTELDLALSSSVSCCPSS